MTAKIDLRSDLETIAASDFLPVLPEDRDGKAWAEACLERAFSPAPAEAASFLVNALCLFGRHRILEWDPADPRVARELARQAYDVKRLAPGGDGLPAGRFDRAYSLRRAFGYGTDAENAAWLKAMFRTLEPGGLLLFHVLDRDRALNLRGDRFLAEGGWRVRAGLAFDPAGGRATARVKEILGPGRGTSPARYLRAEASVRAYHLGEIRAILAGAGFGLERAYGDWDGGNPLAAGERSGRMIVVASRPRVARKADGAQTARTRAASKTAEQPLRMPDAGKGGGS